LEIVIEWFEVKSKKKKGKSMYFLPEGFSFVRRYVIQKRWHIRDERSGQSSPAVLPLCALSGKFNFMTKELSIVKHLCPECRKIAEEGGFFLNK